MCFARAAFHQVALVNNNIIVYAHSQELHGQQQVISSREGENNVLWLQNDYENMLSIQLRSQSLIYLIAYNSEKSINSANQR